MLILSFAVCVILVITGAVLFENTINLETLGLALMTIFSLVGAIVLGFLIVVGCKLVPLQVIDDKIAMYEEENARIETQIADVVEQYQKYETEIFTEVTPESSMTLVALYPELKSDTLVQSQIDIYVQNNEKIKELREKKINEKIYRWWLYFGGK